MRRSRACVARRSAEASSTESSTSAFYSRTLIAIWTYRFAVFKVRVLELFNTRRFSKYYIIFLCSRPFCYRYFRFTTQEDLNILIDYIEVYIMWYNATNLNIWTVAVFHSNKSVTMVYVAKDKKPPVIMITGGFLTTVSFYGNSLWLPPNWFKMYLTTLLSF